MFLLERLEKEFPDSTKSTLRKWVKNGRVAVNGTTTTLPHQEIKENAEITLKNKTKVLPLGIKILYEDRDLIVIDKPEGVLSVATAFERELTAHSVIKRERRNVFPVHRLDRETSGVMVFALTAAARDGLKKQFRDHSIHREYLAVVLGELKGTGTWKHTLLEDEAYFVRPHPQGELAITHYKALTVRPKTTLVRFTLETGKKNQIRAQALAEGFPILGDQKYGKSEKGRLHLHAHKLEFIHPTTGKRLHFKSDAPFAS